MMFNYDYLVQFFKSINHEPLKRLLYTSIYMNCINPFIFYLYVCVIERTLLNSLYVIHYCTKNVCFHSKIYRITSSAYTVLFEIVVLMF